MKFRAGFKRDKEEVSMGKIGDMMYLCFRHFEPRLYCKVKISAHAWNMIDQVPVMLLHSPAPHFYNKKLFASFAWIHKNE